MPLAGFEPTVLTTNWLQAYAFFWHGHRDRSFITVIQGQRYVTYQNPKLIRCQGEPFSIKYIILPFLLQDAVDLQNGKHKVGHTLINSLYCQGNGEIYRCKIILFFG